MDRNLPYVTEDISWKLSLPSRGAWIEIHATARAPHLPASLPSRGAWIEIGMLATKVGMAWVAPLAGSVDRN